MTVQSRSDELYDMLTSAWTNFGHEIQTCSTWKRTFASRGDNGRNSNASRAAAPALPRTIAPLPVVRGAASSDTARAAWRRGAPMRSVTDPRS